MHAALAASLMLGTAAAVALPPTRTTQVAKRDSNAVVNPPAAVDSVNNQDGIGAGSTSYTYYTGDGTPNDGWPSVSQWVSFEDMFNNNKNSMFASCENNDGVANDSGEEVGDIYNAIESVAGTSKLDHRVILAIIMEESGGCVRVPTTLSPDGIYNPGLMQDYEGYYSCNFEKNVEYNQGTGVTNPCPQETITGMVREGAVGTDNGDGLATLVNDAQNQGATGAQTFYVAARWYNSGEGSVPVGGDLGSGSSRENPGYASDIANRLTGWVN